MTAVQVNHECVLGFLDILRKHSILPVEIVSMDDPQLRFWISAAKDTDVQEVRDRPSTSNIIPVIKSPASGHCSIAEVLARQNGQSVSTAKSLQPQPLNADPTTEADTQAIPASVEGSDDGGIDDDDLEALGVSHDMSPAHVSSAVDEPAAEVQISTTELPHDSTLDKPAVEVQISSTEPLDASGPRVASGANLSSPGSDDTEVEELGHPEEPIQLIMTIADGPTKRRLKKEKAKKDLEKHKLEAERRHDQRQQYKAAQSLPTQIQGKKRRRLIQGRRGTDEETNADHEGDGDDSEVEIAGNKDKSPVKAIAGVKRRRLEKTGPEITDDELVSRIYSSVNLCTSTNIYD